MTHFTQKHVFRLWQILLFVFYHICQLHFYLELKISKETEYRDKYSAS